ncbi:MAG: hypothetical protein AAGG00_07775, partial [Cyanobacteria bacterium P01_H01_bin.150]
LKFPSASATESRHNTIFLPFSRKPILLVSPCQINKGFKCQTFSFSPGLIKQKSSHLEPPLRPLPVSCGSPPSILLIILLQED